MSKHTVDLRVPCQCLGGCAVRVTRYHDPGCWRTKNGDGWPESEEYEWDLDECPHCHTPMVFENVTEAYGAQEEV